MLYISMHPCIVVSLSSYLSIDSFFFFPSLVPCIQQSPRVLYSFTSPPIFRYSSRRSDHLCPSRISTLASTFFFPLSKSLILPLCIYIYYTFFIQSSSYLPVSHKFNPTSLRLAPYTFHCSIKRPTRIYTRVYTMNSVVVVVVVQKAAEKANRIRVGHDTS